MRAYVFTDPALTKHAGQFVWLSMDTERLEGEAFLEKFPMDSWPTLWIIDPETEKPLLKWAGSATLAQLEGLLAAPVSTDPGRVTVTLVTALASAQDYPGCAREAAARLPAMPRDVVFENVAALGLFCAEEGKLPLEPLLGFAQESLKISGVLADDESGLYELLVDAKEDKLLAEEWWAFLAAEAAAAKTPEARAAFDPHRVLAAQKCGDPGRVIPVLEASERELPDDYNAPARLALVYQSLGRFDDALAANARALAKVYGPRKLRVLEVEAGLQRKKGDAPAARKTLQDALAYWNGLPKAQRSDGQKKHIEEQLNAVK